MPREVGERDPQWVRSMAGWSRVLGGFSQSLAKHPTLVLLGKNPDSCRFRGPEWDYAFRAERLSNASLLVPILFEPSVAWICFGLGISVQSWISRECYQETLTTKNPNFRSIPVDSVANVLLRGGLEKP